MPLPPEIEAILQRDSQIFSASYSLMLRMHHTINAQEAEIDRRGEVLAKTLVDIGNGHIEVAETRLEEFFDLQNATTP